jgi:programmed cell death 6-interacting protein
MPMLHFPGKKALYFTGDTSATERDKDLALLILARAHVVELASDGAGRHASAAEAATKLRAYLRVGDAGRVQPPAAPLRVARRR